jgi:oligopeptide/dipeptide ABC transporter ATP-binding protein
MTTEVANSTSTHDLEIRDLMVQFPLGKHGFFGRRRVVHAVDGVTFTVPAGEIVGLVGESGSGKSTIARAIMGLNTVTSGSITLAGKELTGLSKPDRQALRRSGTMQMIWQDPRGSLDPRQRIRDAITLGMQRHVPYAAVQARVLATLEEVRLPESVLERRPGQLSGGQNQRVAIARGLMSDLGVLIADEPTSALDVSVQADIGNRLLQLNRELGMSCLLVSHDLGFVSNVASRIVVLYLGCVMESGPAHQVISTPTHPYTAALLAAAPSFGGANVYRAAYRIEGEIPSPIEPPSGCRFSTRCPFARDKCRTEQPQPRRTSVGTVSACHFADEIAPDLHRISTEVLADQLACDIEQNFPPSGTPTGCSEYEDEEQT